MLDFLKFCAKNCAFSVARLLLKIVLFGVLEVAKKNAKSESQVFLPCRSFDIFCVFFSETLKIQRRSRGFWGSQLWFLGVLSPQGFPQGPRFLSSLCHASLAGLPRSSKIYIRLLSSKKFIKRVQPLPLLLVSLGHYEPPEEVFPNRPHPLSRHYQVKQPEK